MLFRCMMILFLLMIFISPAWAGEKDMPPSNIAIEQMSIEEALSKVTIEAEDWLDGDTYYIRCTFTNPTDIPIEKDILYTTVGLFAYWNDTSSKITKVDNSPNRHLSIAPHSETTMLLSFPKEYTHEQYSFRYAYFFFSDNKYLAYDLYPIDYNTSKKTGGNVSKNTSCPVSFDINIIPPADGTAFSTLQLTINNQTPQSFHTIKDLQSEGVFYIPSIDRNMRLDFAEQGPIAVNVPPYSQTTIPFPVLAEDIYAYYTRTPFPFSLSLSLDDKHYEHELDCSKELAYRTRNTPFPFSFGRPSNTAGQPLLSYYIKDNKVHCFFIVHNRYDKPCTLSYVSLYWHYLTPFNTQKTISKKFYYLREPIHLRANESQYYTFSFDLPPDYVEFHTTFLTHFSIDLFTSQGRIDQDFLMKEQYLSPLCQILYQPLHPGDTF